MSASAFTASNHPPSPATLTSRNAEGREGRWARLFRWLADRQHLQEMDARLLCDVGLTHEDVRRGVPFQVTPPCPTGSIRLGTLAAHACQLKLYAPATETAGLRSGDLASVRRAFRAVLAEPGPDPVAGFAILSVTSRADVPAGSLILTAYLWEGMVLRRCVLLLPAGAGPVRRLPHDMLAIADLSLASRECRAWQRHAARPSPSSLAAYLAQDCA